jgi:hypothetical protein
MKQNLAMHAVDIIKSIVEECEHLPLEATKLIVSMLRQKKQVSFFTKCRFYCMALIFAKLVRKDFKNY